MANQEYLSNFSYIFIPFVLQQEADFAGFNQALAANSMWKTVQDDVRYLHRYVADCLVRGTKSDGNLRHYRLDTQYAAKVPLWLNDRWYRTTPKTYKGEADVCFDFQICDVELFSFNTSVGVLAFRLRFRNADPFHIAAAQYYLRKIDAESICVTTDEGTEERQTFIKLSQKLLGNLVEAYSLDFFFYATPKNERANFLTYVDVPEQKDYEEALFYLKWCYHDAFLFEKEEEQCDCMNYTANSHSHWGISPSAAACLVNRTEKTKTFLEGTFQKNFMRQYLLTYVLLLHQKYMLYLLLTKISVNADEDMDKLESYKRQLHAFDSKYVFIKITEVPQYQRFYDRVMQAFSIKEMFCDVEQPLSQLAEIQRLKHEERQQRHDHRTNAVLIVLSCLTIVSAVTDALGITSEIGWLISSQVSKIVQISLASLVLLSSIIVIIRLLFLKKED